MKPSEVREKTDAELVKLSSELEAEIFQLRFKKGAGQLKTTGDIRRKRRDMARVKTVMSMRRLTKEAM